jgi:hypothetical protein
MKETPLRFEGIGTSLRLGVLVCSLCAFAAGIQHRIDSKGGDCHAQGERWRQRDAGLRLTGRG